MATATKQALRSDSELQNLVNDTYALGPDALTQALTAKFNVAVTASARAARQVRPSLGQIWENRKTGRLIEITRLSEGLSGYPLIYAKHTDLLNAPSQGISATEWHRIYRFIQ